MRSLRYFLLLVTGVGIMSLAMAFTPLSVRSANISHSYKTKADIPAGSIVSLDSQQTDYVEPANTDNADRLLGVVVAEGDSLLAVDPMSTTKQVAVSGNAYTLVSTVNGNINVGDRIAVSAFNGVGMKSAPDTYLIGLAETTLDDNTEGAVSRQVTDKNGKTSTIKAGYVKVNISVGIEAASTEGGSTKLHSLQKFVKSFTGRTISLPRIVISLVVAVVTVLCLITLVYASIYGGIISVGRNPLARYAIFRTLGSVLGLAMLTAAFATLSIFLILR